MKEKWRNTANRIKLDESNGGILKSLAKKAGGNESYGENNGWRWR